jgi:hypothetical protein
MLDIRGASPGLLDDPLLLEVGGAAPNAALTWRGRFRDDDGFVWRAAAPTPEGLLTAWVPAKPTAGPVAALRSLRPLDVDVRVEGTDGAASNRTITRRLMDEAVRARRWKDAVVGTLYLPTHDATAALIVDAREPQTAMATPSSDPQTDGAIAAPPAVAEPAVAAGLDAAPLAAALLASRGVLVLVLTGGKDDPLAAARERLAQVPGAPHRIETLDAATVGVPPGVGFRGEDQRAAEARGATWDALLHRLGARPRATR